ncbi:cadherin-like beta sandwich domain-containing protein [Janibacter hoylei]|uniref:cadherin-like beta sandwich domain-containing protein n=1 Tax=Janibacter hoylei TaxID=364298 RepID=UPI0021A490B6|nr:cadherin-like beta sandwich domain-containing protein [Janibacter hoylei]MCT1619384.1 cadherin-like beta sandwich domain-containing protein [Janibacter hoylei]MCT2293969.1 cadherin-like beta sandwich domain-containing protein [Janibacter hoylei]
MISTGRVRVVVAGRASMVRLRVDGQRHPVAGETTLVDLSPGRHRVDVESSDGTTTYGEATSEVDVHPGQQVDLHYAQPRWLWGRGHLGPAPTTRSWAPDWRHIAIGCGGAVALICCCGSAGVLWERLAG